MRPPLPSGEFTAVVAAEPGVELSARWEFPSDGEDAVVRQRLPAMARSVLIAVIDSSGIQIGVAPMR